MGKGNRRWDRVGAASSVGQVRTHNEDAVRIDRTSRFYVVADGMGGHAAGEVASRMAVQVPTRAEMFGRRRLNPARADQRAEIEWRLRLMIEARHYEVVDRAAADPSLTGMGTTIVVLMVVGRWAFIAHVGDSRCYRLRAGRLELLTRDHTVAQGWVDQGRITDEEARTSRAAHILTRALGAEEVPEVDVRVEPIAPGDVFLLCTDGLNGELEDDLIEVVLRSGLERTDPVDVAQALVDLADQLGGRDNTTVVVLQPPP